MNGFWYNASNGCLVCLLYFSYSKCLHSWHSIANFRKIFSYWRGLVNFLCSILIWTFHPSHFTWMNDRPSAPQGNQCLITHFIASLGAQQQTNIALLHINVMINWQLSKQDIHWPVSPDHITGSGVDPSRSSIFLLVFKWSQAQV